jgi:hypothetical protein
MGGRTLAADVKRTSVVRRLPPLSSHRYVAAPGLEGHVCAFQLAAEASPIVVEAASGRAMTLVPGDIFLATPGHRESTRWVVGGIPRGGLVPGSRYWVLAENGIVGELVGDGPLAKTHLQQARYLGAICGDGERILNISQFAKTADQRAANGRAADHGTPVFLIVGTSAEVGKTTASIGVLRTLLAQGHSDVVALKATGTSSFTEVATYRDFGATYAFDCVDFGLPTTYPSNRKGIGRVFERALDTCLSIPADAVLIECGGDIMGANVPVFLKCLKRRRARPKVVLAAADALGALGGKRMLKDIGLSVSLVTGPCTDTPTLRQRTQQLCGIPVMNIARQDG